MSPSAHGLCEFIDASPSPFHVCATVAQRLRDAGFTELAEGDAAAAAGGESNSGGDFFTVRAGSLVAWRAHADAGRCPSAIVGAHTDSPNLRVKQHPDRFVSGWQVVALQPYGGAWLNSWLDRDLGISGRLSVRVGPTAVEHRLVRIDEPILRVPQLAIHLAEDRKAVSLDPQRHVNAVWGVGSGARSFLDYVAEQAGVDARRGARLRPDDPRPDAVDAGGRRRRAAQRAATGQPVHLLRGSGGVPGRRAARLPAGAGAVRPRGGRLPVRPRRAVRAAADGAGAHRAGRGRRSRGLPARGCRSRWWRRATWRTPPTRTTRSGTSRTT